MQAIITKYIGLTNTKPGRIKAASGSGCHITISYDHALDTFEAHREAAIALCNKLNWSTDIIGGGLQYGYAFVFANS